MPGSTPRRIHGERVLTYDTLRALLIVLVLVGHSGYYSIETPYGGCDYSFLFHPTSVTMVLSAIIAAIYTFHMPLFMALSGAVAARGGVLDARRFAKKRVARLLVPFLLCAVLWTIPLKYIAGYWDGSIDVCRDIVVGQILLQGNTHLWFLPTLYAISIIHLLIERYLPGHVGLKVIGLLLASLCSSAIPLEFISLVLRHYVWYYLGWLFENSGLRNKLANGHGHRRLLMFAAAGFLVSFGLYYWLGYDSGMPLTMLLLRRLLAYVCTLFGSALTYLLALSLSEKQGSLTHRLSSSSLIVSGMLV